MAARDDHRAGLDYGEGGIDIDAGVESLIAIGKSAGCLIEGQAIAG